LNNYIPLLFVAVLINTAYGQPITGKVIDDHGDPLPFAHVIMGNNGSVTNVEGYYVLQNEENDSILNVTFVGFNPARVNIHKEPYDIIKLEPSSINLDEVTVIVGPEVLDEFQIRTIVNYEMEAQRMTSYYKEKLVGNDSLFYLAEGILDIYEPSNVSDKKVQINPIRTRRKVMRDIDPNQITLISGSAFDMVKSSIWRENTFLSDENIQNYEFEFLGKVPYNERKVFRIIFFPKNSKGYISGEMFIEEESYAIVKLVYEPEVKSNMIWSWVKWTEEFDNFNGNYQLTCVTFNGKWEEMNTKFEYEALLINSDFIKSKPEYILNPTITKKDIFVEKAADDFSEAFWDGYNFLKLTDSETE